MACSSGVGGKVLEKGVGKLSKETESVWNGKYLESSFRGKLDKFVRKACVEFDTNKRKGESEGLKGAECNLDRIRRVRDCEEFKIFLDKYETELENAVKTCEQCTKSQGISEKCRHEGNEFYKNNDLRLALKGFTLSLCFASCNSKELVLAYSNRSACFMEMNQFQDSLNDIEKALHVLETHHKENKDLEVVKKKLTERKVRCEEKVTEKNNNHNDQELTKDWTNYSKLFTITSHNEFIDAAADFVTIADDPGRGRHVKVTEDVVPGTVIILEEPYSKVLVKHLQWEIEFCHFCFKDISNMPCLPCSECVYAVYCNEKCLKSNEAIHKYDCKMSPYLHKLEPKRLVLLSYRTLMRLGPEKLYQFWKSQDEVNPSQNNRILGFNPDGKYISSSYYSINCLIYHDESLTDLELLQYSIESVLIIDLLDKNTDFFRSIFRANNNILEIESLKDFASSLILLHQMNFPCNAHSLNLLKLSSKNPSVEEVRLATTTDFGAGAFALLSMINHSCDPNVTRVTLDNGINAVVTIRNLKAGDEVLDNYGAHYALEDYDSRQEHLKSNYNFQCDCVACTNNWPTMEKLQESGDTLMCSQCSQTVKMQDYFKKPFKEECILHTRKCNRCAKTYDLNGLIKDLQIHVDNFNLAYESVLQNRPFETIKTLTECLNYFESHVLPPTLRTNFAQETLKHALNLIALSYQ